MPTMTENDDLDNLTIAYQKVCSELGYYNKGLIEEIEQARTPIQKHLFNEAERLIKNIDALYFSGDIPFAYFRLLSQFNKKEIIELHRRIWNQNRVPFLYVVTPTELRIYNCFEEPVNTVKREKLDTKERLIKKINLATDILKELNEFSNEQIDSGAFWKSKVGRYFRSDKRVDQNLLKNLRITRKKLRTKKLDYPIIHNLLGRSIFILYLEDRGAITKTFYSKFLEEAATYFDILKDKEATYCLFEKLETKFNGDLFPKASEERTVVDSAHLKYIRELFYGTQMDTGQRPLWRCYDFGIIPIELISAIYEEFLHTEGSKGYISKKGAYYTPHALVEFIINEVLPWPSERDNRYDLKILDPACGSGIFLVEAFRRLVARWKFSNHNADIPHDQLTYLLTTCIYGADINEDAIKVAAFSLYLALLDYLEPKTIWEEFQFPYLVYKLDELDRSGRNLFPQDTFEENIQFERSDYDIVVGNPPWKRDGLRENVSQYLRKRAFAQEFAQAFLWRARDFASNGIIAMLSTSKVLFNTEERDRHFRREFFSKNDVEMVVNFSALKQKKGKTGRQLFASSLWPATVFFYRPNPSEQSKSTILYCTPKPKRSDDAIPSIIIDASEIKFLPKERCIISNNIWKIAMWATKRDLDFIESLPNYKTIKKFINENEGWSHGRGFQKSEKGKYEDNEIAKLPFIEAESIQRYMLFNGNLEKFGSNRFERLGIKEVYYAPHILIKEGQCNKRFCATFADFDCAFKDTVTGISAKTKDEKMLKALVAYLNSTFASYFLFLTSSSWGIEKPRVYPTEVLNLPCILFQISKGTINELANKVDSIGLLLSNGVSETDERIVRLESEIDGIIYSSLNLSETERFLINDVIRYSLNFSQEGEKSKAEDNVNVEELAAYGKAFCKSINSILQFGELRAAATVYPANAPLCLVSIRFSNNKDVGTVKIIDSTDKLDSALANLEQQNLQEFSDSIYLRRNVKFYDKNTLHITKPNEKRFWTRSMALCDADETLAEGLNLET
jgi:type I restriction-modification system DNA methylase subunit